MIFRAIRLNNYGIYAGAQVIEPVDGHNGRPNITLIGGLNGRGKTSLLDAVLLALYGSRTPSLREQGKAYSAYLESLVHKSAGAELDTYVELQFEAPLGNHTCDIRLRRSWRNGNKRFTDRLEIWRDGILDPHLADNWPSQVEELLPSGLAGLFFFDGEKIAALAEADESGDSLKHSIRALLGLDLVDKLIADMGTVIRRNQAKLRDSTTREELERLHSQGQELDLKQKYTGQKISQLNAKICQLEGKRQEYEQSFFEAGGRLAQERESLRAKELDLTSKLQDSKSEAAFLAAGPSPLLLVLPMLQQVQATARRESATLEARSALRLLQERDARLSSHLKNWAGDSPVVKAAQSWMDQDRAAMTQLASESVTFNLSVTATVQIDQLLRSADEIRHEAQELRAQAKLAHIELDQVKDHLDIYVDEDRVQSSLSELATLTRTIAHLKHEREVFQQALLVVERELDQVKRRMTNLASALGDVEDTERIISYAGKTQETMRIYREKATRQKVDVLTREIGKAFDTLTHKTTLVTELRMDSESLRISLHDSEGREIPKVRLSSGEKQMLAIAILWGLAKASGRTLPVIIDTPMGRLDSSHRMNFVTKYLPNASHQVLVLSTDTEIVGPYLESLNGSIGRKYLLRYDEELQRTEVQPGYFQAAGGDVQ